MKFEIITFFIQLCVKFAVVYYDECQVQVICFVIQSISLFNIYFRWVNVFEIVYKIFVVANSQVIYILVTKLNDLARLLWPLLTRLSQNLISY